MNECEKYSTEWCISAEHFLANGNYDWMCSQINAYNTILEIGCGTGQSTLSLIRKGHTVIVVEKNKYCIQKAIEYIKSAGVSTCTDITLLNEHSVLFIEDDITSENFISNILPILSFDMVICWNVGTYWDKRMFQSYMPKLLNYGLSLEQIKDNPESSYGELIIWFACQIATSKNAALNIVDRGVNKLTRFNDPYYSALKREFSFRKIKYKNLKATSISAGGRQLITKGKVDNEKEIPINFISITLK